MLDEEMLAAVKRSTNIITRRTFLKTLTGTAAGFFFFGLVSLKNDAKLVPPQPALVIADEVQPPPHRYQPIINKPFINAFNHIVTPTYDRSNQAVHPSVKGPKEWYMWTTDGSLTMHLYTSIDGTTWSSGQPCSVPWDTWNGGYIPWHIAAKPNHLEQKIEFLIAGWPKKGTIKDCQLFYATAPISQPKELSMPLLGPLLGPGAGDQWDNGYIYRSSFVLEPGDALKFRIWYSACSREKIWQIGYTEGTLDNIPSNSQQA